VGIRDMIADMRKGMNDHVLSNSMMGSAKALGSAYVVAAFQCAAPEIRRMFMQFADQAVQAHGALTELCLRKGWHQVYDTPDDQLKDWYSISTGVVAVDPGPEMRT
jgi:spore coat protein CotF